MSIFSYTCHPFASFCTASIRYALLNYQILRAYIYLILGTSSVISVIRKLYHRIITWMNTGGTSCWNY